MFTTTVQYKDFLGNQRTKTLYFHLTMEELERMMLEHSVLERNEGGDIKDAKIKENFTDHMQRVIREGTILEILDFFDDLVSRSYGIIKDDGETFVQGKEVYDAWRMTASYSAFMKLLKGDQKVMEDFVNQMMPDEVRELTKQNEDPEFRRHREELEKRASDEE